MKTTIRLCALAAAALLVALMALPRLTSSRNQPAISTATAVATHSQEARVRTVAGGPGLVEPASEEIRIGFDTSGQLRSVQVEEGQRVKCGQLLAVLMNDELKAQVMAAEATVLARGASLRKVLNGARRQERLEAMAVVRKARAVMDNASSELARREQLLAASLISRQEMDRFTREYNVARAEYEQALERHSLVDDPAREEDRASAEAELQLARAELEQARARYARTFLTSPIDGTVLRKLHHKGESISNSSIVPDPVVTIGNTQVLRVRADIDEADVMRVRVGQRAYVTAQAFGEMKFWGHVIRLAARLGPKNIRTEEPAERVDTKILETLVELDDGADLPVGLRVSAFILDNSGR